jgi:hypothetical protein
MKTQVPNTTGSLTRNHWDVPIRVRLLPYVEFSRWMDGELEKLVAQWWDHAAPAVKKKQFADQRRSSI